MILVSLLVAHSEISFENHSTWYTGPMGICLIFNPAARGSRAAQLRDQLAGLSQRCSLQPTYAPGDAQRMAQQAVQDGFETIVAAGGDGTVNEVLNGMAAEPAGLNHARLAVLPAGTANVFARQLGMPLRLEQAWQVIQDGREQRIDLPYADFTQCGQQRRRYFVQLAGAGVDTRANTLVDPEQKKRWGASAYVLAGCEAVSESKPTITVTGGEGRHDGELVLVGNGQLYGGPFRFFPQASLDDGKLDVLVFPKVTWATVVEFGWGWLTGQLHTIGRAVAFQADRFDLASSSPVLFQLDGENVAPLPVHFNLLPQELRVVVP